MHLRVVRIKLGVAHEAAFALVNWAVETLPVCLLFFNKLLNATPWLDHGRLGEEFEFLLRRGTLKKRLKAL